MGIDHQGHAAHRDLTWGDIGPSHAALKAISAEDRRERELTMTVDKLMVGMPTAWVTAVREQWGDIRKTDPIASARWGFDVVGRIRSAEKLGIVTGDSDADLCRKAMREARLMGEYFDAVAVRVRRRMVGAPLDLVARVIERAQAFALRADMARRGLLDLLPRMRRPGKVWGITRVGLLARAKCDRWWRRVLRRTHATMLESAAIGLGLVRAGRRGACYVSHESVKRRRGQLARQAAGLEATSCVNERAQSISLAEVASRGVANKEVRRCELMTRISGFEVIGDECGHLADFITVTCPSRMHKWKRGDKLMTRANPIYDGTLPSEAQAYLGKQWAAFRSQARHMGLRVYGFRISEPHHDGCPHWHILLWREALCDPPRTKREKALIAKGLLSPFQADSGATLRHLLQRYFLLNDSPNQRGAKKHRITIEPIDKAKGSAVAYVAKYVAKNIDGYRVERDLYGNDTLESSARVEAWASTWRIRQFQQLGGAPVGVWRELRRVRPDVAPLEADGALHDALMMVNVDAVDTIMGGQVEEDSGPRIREGWAAYNKAQGGPFVARKALKLRVLREASGECNRYGEVGAPVTLGIAAFGVEKVRVGMCHVFKDRVDQVESERLQWLVVPKAGETVAVAAWKARVAADELVQRKRLVAAALDHAVWMLDHGVTLLARGEALRPWTRVNNCAEPEPLGGVRVVRTKKTGQVFDWKKQKAAREGRSHMDTGGDGRHRGPVDLPRRGPPEVETLR